MTKRELFKRRVIELIHGKPYKEAIKNESTIWSNVIWGGSFVGFVAGKKTTDDSFVVSNKDGWIPPIQPESICELEFLGLPCTIGRLMQSLENLFIKNGKKIDGKKLESGIYDSTGSRIELTTDGRIYNCILGNICFWKLTKENGQECTDDDQTDETIEALYQLIK